jgi:sterol desaturase/sphingolipid hydroxylase (fatty acid hydroxylase superfamily)
MLTSLFLDPIRALLVAAAVFVPVERLAGARSGQPIFRKGWGMDVVTALLNGVVLYAVLLAALAAVDAVASGTLPQLRSWAHTRPLWLQGAFAVVLGDLGVYAIHRLVHTVPWLWRLHAVHHSAEELDWLIAVRHHPIDLLLFRVSSLGPLVALDLTPAAIAVFVAVFSWQSWLVHANVRLAYGPLRFLVVSPDFHHWHHSAERAAYNKNYASLFALWDVMFGTLHLPSGSEPSRYGIEEHIPSGWLLRLIHPFRHHS